MPYRRTHPGQGSGPPRYPGTFLLAFREALAKLGWQARRWLGPAVECSDAQGREQVVGLENLFRRVRSEDRSTWPDLIAGFLSSVASEQIDNPPSDLDAVADRLLVRLGPPLGQRVGGLDVWHQPLGETGLGMNLVIDYPQSMSYVTEEMVNKSSRPARDWIEQALANLAKQTPADCLQVIDCDSGLRHCAIGDAYDTSRALLLDKLLPETTEEGYFVALPGRDQLLILPVTPAGLASIHMLKMIAEKYFKTAPYSISDQVFWVLKGQWYPFRVEMSKEKVSVHPPDEFLPVLQRLAPEQDRSEGKTSQAGGEADESSDMT
jgi:hypothetical protein